MSWTTETYTSSTCVNVGYASSTDGYPGHVIPFFFFFFFCFCPVWQVFLFSFSRSGPRCNFRPRWCSSSWGWHRPPTQQVNRHTSFPKMRRQKVQCAESGSERGRETRGRPSWPTYFSLTPLPKFFFFFLSSRSAHWHEYHGLFSLFPPLLLRLFRYLIGHEVQRAHE